MSKQISSLWVGLTGNITGLAKSFGNAINGPIKGLQKGVQGATGAIGSFAGSALKLTGIGAAISGAIGAVASIGKGFSFAAEMEQNEVALTTMLGSADKAKAVLKDMTDFAAETPFEMPELARATKGLLAFGVEQQKLFPTMRAIGDIAAGVGAPIDELAELYGKAKVQGRLFAQDINQLTGRGIPIIQEFAKQFGVSEDQVKGLVESGQIGFPQLEKAFASLTSNGGKFAGLMEAQSGTLSGLMSTLSDNVNIALGGIAKTIIDTFNFKGGISALISGVGSIGDRINGFVQYAAPLIKGFGATVLNVFSGIYQTVAPIVLNVFGVISRVFTQLVPFMTAVGSSIWAGIVSTWNAITGFLYPIVVGIGEFIAANWQRNVTTTTAYLLSLWNVVKSVWGIISSLASSVWSGITAVWRWGASLITGETQTTGDSVKSIWQGMADVANWLMEKVTTAFNVIAFAVTNWRDTIKLAAVTAAYNLVKFANETIYFFSDVIPGVLKWFGDNWRDIFKTIWNYTSTVVQNLYKNVTGFFEAVWSALKGDGFDFTWTALTEGFENTIKEMPKIAARIEGDMERELREGAEAIGSDYGSRLAESLAAQRKQAADAAKKLTAGIDKALTPDTPKIETPTIPTPEVPKMPQVTLDAALDPSNLTVDITPKLKQAKAIMAGSAEAQALRFAAIPGVAGGAVSGGRAIPATSPRPVAQPISLATATGKDAQTDIQKKQLTESEQQTLVLREIAKKTAASAFQIVSF